MMPGMNTMGMARVGNTCISHPRWSAVGVLCAWADCVPSACTRVSRMCGSVMVEAGISGGNRFTEDLNGQELFLRGGIENRATPVRIGHTAQDLATCTSQAERLPLHGAS